MLSEFDEMSDVSLKKLSLNAYASIIGEEKTEEIRILAENLRSKHVCHVNSTSFGGGVAEILQSIVPLMCDAGLKVEWKVINGSYEFFNITKNIHNGLQGMDVSLSEQMKRKYLENNKANAQELNLNHEFIVIHDYQPAAIISYYPVKANKWIWRCHIDLSTPNMTFWKFLEPYIQLYDAAIFSMKKYVRPNFKMRKIAIIPPSIDPLSEKNKEISESLMLKTLEKYDVDPDKPIITQVARFDPWKDPLGAIEVYRLIKRKMPDLQLLLISSMAHDDPEGWLYYEKTVRHAGEDYDIHFLTDRAGVGGLEVNAFQRATNVALQMSTREGFGLSVTEALWKRVPVVGRKAGGIPLQVIDGLTGFLVDDVKEAAEKTFYLLKHPEKAEEMGEKGRKHVVKNFLITRHLKDYLKLFNELLKKT